MPARGLTGESSVTMYSVILSPKAGEYYQQSPASLAAKLARCLEQLAIEPRKHNNIKSLKGAYKGYHRYRVGDYRVIYRIDESAKQVRVSRPK
jgi:mRNA interferase RelE/StbE